MIRKFTLAFAFMVLLLLSGCIEKSKEEPTPIPDTITSQEEIEEEMNHFDELNIPKVILPEYMYYSYTYTFPPRFPNYLTYDEYGKKINFLTQKNFVSSVRTDYADYDKEYVLFLAYFNYGSPSDELHQFIEVYNSRKSAKNRAKRIINFAIRSWHNFTLAEENSSHFKFILNREVLCGVVHTPINIPKTKLWYVCQFRKENTIIAIANENEEKVHEFTEKLIRQMNENKTKKFPIILLPNIIKDYKLLSYSASYNNPEVRPKKIIEGIYLLEKGEKAVRIRIEDWEKGIESWVKEIRAEKNRSYREINGAKCITLNFTGYYIPRCVLGNFTIGVYFPYNESLSVVEKVGDNIVKEISKLNLQKGFSVSIKTCYEKSNLREKEKCFMHIAMEENNPRLCEIIQNETIRDNCYLNLAYEEPELCEKVNSEQQKDFCYYFGAEGKGNSTFCKQIKSEDLKERCYQEARWVEKYGFHP
jgi:hypothetical protein